MKRIITMLAVAMAFGVFASAASAHPGGASGSARISAGTKAEWTAETNPTEFYGPVKCTGKTVVNKKFPGGREIEICETTGEKLTHMKAGKGQTSFEGENGNHEAIVYSEWESDHVPGMKTTNFSYSVNKKLTKFKLIAIYPAPPPAE